MVNNSENLHRGEYCGSVLSSFPTKRWIRHSIYRSCVFITITALVGITLATLICQDMNSFKEILMPLTGALVICFGYSYPASFSSFVRVDFFQEDILLYIKVFFFNNFYLIRMRRKNVVTCMKIPTLLSLKDIFDPLGRCNGFKLSHKDGWDADSLSSIHDHIKNRTNETNDPSLEQLCGSYIGTVESKGSKYKLFFFTFIPRFVIVFSITLIILFNTSVLWTLMITSLILKLYYELFVIIRRIDVYDGEISFLGKEQFQGTSRGYIVNVRKISVQDTRDIFHARVLKIKEEGSFFPIRLSKRHGWSDAELDEVKEVITMVQSSIASS